MMEVVEEHVFPFLRSLDQEGSSYGRHMRDARLGFSNPALLARAVEMLDKFRWKTHERIAQMLNQLMVRRGAGLRQALWNCGCYG
jgi:type I restriction enzyme M protein